MQYWLLAAFCWFLWPFLGRGPFFLGLYQAPGTSTFAGCSSGEHSLRQGEHRPEKVALPGFMGALQSSEGHS